MTHEEKLEVLKPCPFCEETRIRIKSHGSSGDCWAHCRSCFSDGPMKDSEAEAIAAWNTRAIDRTEQRLSLAVAEAGMRNTELIKPTEYDKGWFDAVHYIAQVIRAQEDRS